MKPTNVKDPEFYHKTVDCQYACPAHTPVPEYIRLIAQERYTDAYMINWESNVFPSVLGRVCDRPCEPACRRGRVDDEPVAICRLKRVAADNFDHADFESRLPEIQAPNGKKIGIIGYGHIGSQVSIMAEALGMQVYYYDVDLKLPLGNAQALENIEEVISKCDFITLHVPATPETNNLFSKEMLSKFKKGKKMKYRIFKTKLIECSVLEVEKQEYEIMELEIFKKVSAINFFL